VTVDRERRRFLSVALAAAAAFVAAGCNPSHKRRAVPLIKVGPGSFGDRIDIGHIDDVRASIAKEGTPRYIAEARAYVVAFPARFAGRAEGVYPKDALPVLEDGIIVLYQRCTHLGCRVPWCKSSEWFECPCHGAKFDQVGERRQGPAPRGMDIMRSSIESGRLVVDTGTILRGVPLGTNTTHRLPAGPFCV
jgi:cytochrome b6-f complex iron-sulfur subunit